MANVRDTAVSVVRALQEAGHTAYFAGGCVRDEMLGHKPEDYDVATSATPDEMRAVFRTVTEVGVSFGVMLVHRHGVTVEAATFRREGPYSDSRRPDSVEFASAEADADRRDFTINALFLDPLAPADAAQPLDDSPAAARLARPDGRVIDFVGGVSDLVAGIVRAVGDANARLAEDHLRGLRAVRIASRLDFRIDASTAEAIRRHARALEGVSRERVGEECRRMLSAPTRARAVSLIESLLLARPTLGSPIGVDEPAKTPTVSALPDAATAPTVLAAWALDRLGSPFETPPTDAVCEQIVQTLRRSLCLSNEERDLLAAVLRHQRTLQRDWRDASVACRKRVAASPWFAQASALLLSRDADAARALVSDVQTLRNSPQGVAPQPFLTGDDVAAIVGGPGPQVGRLLRTLYDAQLENRVQTRTEALALARLLASPADNG